MVAKRFPRSAYVLSGLACVAVCAIILLMAASPKGQAADSRASSVDERLADTFAVFRDRPTARAAGAPEVPGLLRRAVSRTTTDGLNPDLTRVVHVSPAVTRYLVPGKGTVGLLDVGGAGGTTSVEDAVAGQLVGTAMCGSVPDGIMRVTGLLPDTAFSAVVVLRGGTRLPIDGSRNVWSLDIELSDADSLPSKVEWLQDGETRSAPIATGGADDLNVRCFRGT